jgi:topoisomerase-4 subunit A
MLMILEDQAVSVKDVMKVFKGPDFPTGGILVEPKDNIRAAYETGRGSFRLRARWEREELKGGQYEIVVTEIPYQVQKSKLVEKIAELIAVRKIPMLEDVRDESAEDIRLVIVPKSRNVEAELLMEALFRHTELETRFALNMNVLEEGRLPRVMNLKEVLQNWLDHQKTVLVRRSQHRLDKVVHRLEILAGYLIVYLNIDKVIKIIREEDEPKPRLIKTFKLTDVQAEAILNMRLRALRKLEEMELRREHDDLSTEKDALEKLIGSDARQWTRIKKQVTDLQKMFGPDTKLGKRRSKIGAAPALEIVDLDEALIEKEPVTIICSSKGWIRAMKGHGLNHADFKYKDGDRAAFVLEAQTTDKILLFATNGRFYTIGADKLPPGRGFGEPVRLMVDLPNDSEVITVMVHDANMRLLVASSSGHGFIVRGADVLAQTKSGKQILNVAAGQEAVLCRLIADAHDYIATIGSNRKMLVFKLAEVPEMARGKGVILQRIKDGSLADAKSFTLAQRLTFRSGARDVQVTDIKPWIAQRAGAGKLPPNGFPRTPKF